jgi:hypothetical protein
MHGMNTPPTPKIIRLTIPVTPEVHAAFQRIGKAASIPTGRAMGEWLRDTLDAAEYLAQMLEKARAAPKIVAQELHAYALGISDETGTLLKRIREGGLESASGHAQRAPERSADPLTPPSSNTGGKVPGKGKKPVKARPLKVPLPAAKVQAYADTNGIPPKGRKS